MAVEWQSSYQHSSMAISTSEVQRSTPPSTLLTSLQPTASWTTASHFLKSKCSTFSLKCHLGTQSLVGLPSCTSPCLSRASPTHRCSLAKALRSRFATFGNSFQFAQVLTLKSQSRPHHSNLKFLADLQRFVSCGLRALSQGVQLMSLNRQFAPEKCEPAWLAASQSICEGRCFS